MDSMQVGWSPLTARVWATRLEPDAVTCGLVLGSDHVLLVDTGSTPAQGRALTWAAARALDRPVDRVVVTHHHGDHAGGLAGIEGAEVWMHRSAARRIGGLDGIEHPISLMAYLDLGGLGVEVIHPGTGHTDGDLVVRVAEERVTFAGDLIESAGDPQADESTDFWNWPSAIASMVTATDGQGRYVPGHGDPVDAGAAMAQNADIAACVDQVKQSMEAGTPVEKIQTSHDWPFSDSTVADWVPRIADQLVARGVTRRRMLPLTQR